MKKEKGYTRLVANGIKPSLQRIAIMDYLIGNENHPTVEMIFSELYPNIPTLSRTTVYNTLKILVEQGAVQMLTIDDKNCRYDANIAPHAHFKCNRCGCIKDLPIKEENIFGENLGEIKITETQIYCKGYCKQCQENIDTNIN